MCNASELRIVLTVIKLKKKEKQKIQQDVTCKAYNIYYLALYRKICQQLFCSFSV